MDWQTIINTIGSLYPDENFWNWLKTAFPEGYPTVMGQDVASSIDKFYKEYQSGTEAIGQLLHLFHKIRFWAHPQSKRAYHLTNIPL